MKYILSLVLMFKTSFLFCQLIHSTSIGPDLGVASNFGKSSKASIGGSFEYVAKFSGIIGVRLSAGYNKFKGKDISSQYVSFLPVRAGVQAFVYEDLIFGFAEGGIARFKSSSGTEKTGPSFAMGGGYRMPIANSQFLQLSVYFNYYRYKGDPPGGDFNYTWFNFRVAYGLSFGKKNAPKE